jgi:hypothetical protein
MKFNTLLFLLLLICLACGDDNKKLENEFKNASETVNNASKLANEAKSMQENITDLRSKEHLSEAQFESWLPETLLGMPRSTTSINMIPGMGSCGVHYKEGNKRIRVMIIDGAGEKGAGGVGPYRMSSKMDYDQKDEWGYTKTRVIDGLKVKESYRKSADSYTLSMFYDNRFAVDIETFEIAQSALDQIVSELNLKALSKF